MGYAVVQQACS